MCRRSWNRNLEAGDGGLGKSLITLHLAARGSRGPCCCGLDYSPPPPWETLLVSCEDDYEDTVLPRLLAANADPSKIFRAAFKADFDAEQFKRLREQLAYLHWLGPVSIDADQLMSHRRDDAPRGRRPDGIPWIPPVPGVE